MAVTQEQIAALVNQLREDQPVTQDMESTMQCALQDEAADMLEQLAADMLAVCQREAATIARYDAKLDAAERAKPAGVRVKRLHWQGYWAESPYGPYSVWEGFENEQGRWCVNWSGSVIAHAQSLETATAAAQADYEARILAALEPAPDARTYADGLREGVKIGMKLACNVSIEQLPEAIEREITALTKKGTCMRKD